MKGLLLPFQRDQKSGLAVVSGHRLLASRIRQILFTEEGELEHMKGFGSRLSMARHRTLGEELDFIIQSTIEEAIRAWEPGVRVTRVTVRPMADGSGRSIQIRFVPIDRLGLVTGGEEAVDVPI